DSDKDFLNKASQGGEAEVELGQLAADKASDPKVKDFGQRMVTDHGQANQKLQQIAQQSGVTPPTGLDPKDQSLKDRLSKLSGKQFDRVYMQNMVKDHQQDISDFQKEAQNGGSSAVKD